MPDIKAERTSAQKVRFTVDGATIEAVPKSSKKLVDFATKAGVDILTLLDAVPQPFRPTGDPEIDGALAGCVIPPLDEAVPPMGFYDMTEEDPGEAAQRFELRVRGRYEKAATATAVERATPLLALDEAFELTGKEKPVAEWRDKRRMAVLDLDWHTGPVPEETTRNSIMLALNPWPARWWLSPRGAHAVYVEVGDYQADELAAAAAVGVVRSCDAEVEVLARTAFPPGEVHAGPTDVHKVFALWRNNVVTPANQEVVADYLADRGLAIGGRFSHERCPFAPGPNTQGGTPVLVTDEGVTCFSCRGAGRRSFAPLPALAGGYEESPLVTSARAVVYFDHARHIVAKEAPTLPEPLRRPAWRGFLRLVLGGDDPRIPGAMVTHYVVRGAGGIWLDALTFSPVSPQVGVEVTRRMPCAQYVIEDEDEKVRKLDVEKHDLLRTNQQLRGLTEIVPVRGLPLWAMSGRSYETTNRVRATPPQGGRFQPAWTNNPAPLSRIIAHFADRFPGINVPYLMLLIAARAHGESGIGPVPMIAATGPTGSGKTMTVHLAAHIVGDAAEAILQHQPDKLHHAIGDASMRAGYLLLDEYGKKGPPDELAAQLLGLSREFSYRRLYVGQVTVPLNSAVVLTNTEFPEAMRSHAQLGRRVVLAELTTRGPDWQTRCGTGDIRMWRSDPQNAAMADALVVHVVRQYLRDRFVETAADLGFSTLEDVARDTRGDSEAVAESLIRDLYDALEEGVPGPRPLDGRGWILVMRDGDDPVSRAWAELCDDPGTRDGFAGSRAISELDLQKVLGAKHPVRLRTRGPHGRKLVVRFEDSEGAFNGEIECTD